MPIVTEQAREAAAKAMAQGLPPRKVKEIVAAIEPGATISTQGLRKYRTVNGKRMEQIESYAASIREQERERAKKLRLTSPTRALQLLEALVLGTVEKLAKGEPVTAQEAERVFKAYAAGVKHLERFDRIDSGDAPAEAGTQHVTVNILQQAISIPADTRETIRQLWELARASGAIGGNGGSGHGNGNGSGAGVLPSGPDRGGEE